MVLQLTTCGLLSAVAWPLGSGQQGGSSGRAAASTSPAACRSHSCSCEPKSENSQGVVRVGSGCCEGGVVGSWRGCGCNATAQACRLLCDVLLPLCVPAACCHCCSAQTLRCCGARLLVPCLWACCQSWCTPPSWGCWEAWLMVSARRHATP